MMAVPVEPVLVMESLKSPNEIDLVQAAKKGDLDAFNQLVILYQDRIYNLALRILGDEDLAEDITQDTFLTAYRSLPGFRNGSFRSWLYRIGTNACYDEIRRIKRHPMQSLDYEDGEQAQMPLAHTWTYPAALPEREFERQELVQTLQQALSQLSTEQRSVVALVDLQEFDYNEAAQVLGIPVGTLKSRLARARERLSTLLRQSQTEDDPAAYIFN